MLQASVGQVGQHTDGMKGRVKQSGKRVKQTTEEDLQKEEVSSSSLSEILGNVQGLSFLTDRSASSNSPLPSEMSARCQRSGKT